ncbi:putative endo beta n-acetylglucosaminidase [Corchorus olitorius]|uniref:Endo beta n-acetylglucosaminidase n=1 Tax=Corchorus olitorius TaxID=93759 RepID=A0A1R3L1D2_9ROSI|nr:putative endo beta n-acetylglucosaminidase [Corchorus olitorius]
MMLKVMGFSGNSLSADRAKLLQLFRVVNLWDKNQKRFTQLFWQIPILKSGILNNFSIPSSQAVLAGSLTSSLACKAIDGMNRMQRCLVEWNLWLFLFYLLKRNYELISYKISKKNSEDKSVDTRPRNQYGGSDSCSSAKLHGIYRSELLNQYQFLWNPFVSPWVL